METLSIFCIGTSHDRSEPWTLMRALYDLTAAAGEVLPADLPGATPDKPHVKVLFDGPEVRNTSNKFLLDACADAVTFIKKNNPQRVCLLGHSRGAVLATMIAARLHLEGLRAPPVFLWLLDTVARTGTMGGGPRVIEPFETLTVYPNVDHVVRVVMEDDPRTFFPLEEVRICLDGESVGTLDYEYEKQSGASSPEVTLIRMPGSHGTGTQVNPVAQAGSRLPTKLEGRRGPGINNARPGRLWPIGEACLINALRAIRDVNKEPAHPTRRGVPLTRTGNDFAGSNSELDTLLDAYARILMENRRTSSGWFRRNDVDRKPRPREGGPRREIQKVFQDPGIWDAGSRLHHYGRDFRSNALIVNEQHRFLLGQQGREDWAAAFEEAGRTHRWRRFFKLPSGIEEMRRKLPAQMVLFALDDVELEEI